MAAKDTVIQILRPPPSADNHEVGIAPVLLGFVEKAGSGPGLSNVVWSNGQHTVDHSDSVLRTLATPFKTQYQGMRARPVNALGGIASAAIGVIVLQDANDLFILQMPSGIMYSLTLANIQILDL